MGLLSLASIIYQSDISFERPCGNRGNDGVDADHEHRVCSGGLSPFVEVGNGKSMQKQNPQASEPRIGGECHGRIRA